ncbi:MAG: hypothetical protein Q9181_004318 [Wetmoreana brouardii]
MQSTTWSPMVSGPDDDFSSFLEFGDLQLNFPNFDSNPQDGDEIQDAAGPPMEMQTDNSPGAVLSFEHGIQQFTDPSSLGDFSSSSHPFPDLTMPSQIFRQQQHQDPMSQHNPYGQLYHGPSMVPPTPNSIEMHGGHAQYQQAASNNHARAIYDHYRLQPKGQVSQVLDTLQWSLP